MGKLALKASAVGAFVVVIAGACVACSSSSSTGSTPSGDGGGTPLGDGGGSTTGGCSVVTTDLQALVPQPITVSGDLTGACNGKLANGTLGIAVLIYNPDADKSLYNIQFVQGTSHAITGYGDEAYYNDGDQATGTTGPDFHAHKGDVTCAISSNAPPNTTMKTTAAGNGYTVTAGDETAYIALMGKVCMDVFAAQ